MFEGPELSILVVLATSTFIFEEEFLLIIYSDSDSSYIKHIVLHAYHT